MPAAKEEKICLACNKPFLCSLAHPNRKYCSNRCNGRKYMAYSPITLPTATVGAMHELSVSVDLMKKGYYVFRSMSANSPADLAAVKDGKTMLIEVTTGCRTFKGQILYPKHKKHAHIFDVIAVVEYSGEITYIPEGRL